ncbi:MAG: DNA methyltransferase [Nodosilinea sp.]
MPLQNSLPWSNPALNQLAPADRAIHDWYRFVLSFPPHLVRHYLKKFQVTADHCVLDPFAGTGTTLVECRQGGIPSLGLEANPMAHFAGQTKLDWQLDPNGLLTYAEAIARQARADLAWFPGDSLRHTLPEASEQVLLRNCISPKPLHKALLLLKHIEDSVDRRFIDHAKLALAKAVVGSASNLRFAPEASVVRAREDAPVIDLWLQAVKSMVADLLTVQPEPTVTATIYQGDARYPQRLLTPNSIDMVITSPPYPNEKDYTRNTRLESVLLGFIRDRNDLRRVKDDLLRSNSRNIYIRDTEDQLIADFPEILNLAATIDQRRLELGKTSGFSRLYSRVIRLYFGGMVNHFQNLRPLLRPGAQLAYVVGDQASYLGVLIPTGELLAMIAESLGYRVLNLDLFRTRRAASTNVALKEEVLLLQWPGKGDDGRGGGRC